MNHLVNTVQSQLDGEYLHTDMFNKKLAWHPWIGV